MITHTSPKEALVKCDRVSPCELSFFETIGIKHRLPDLFLWQKHGLPVGVLCLRPKHSKQRLTSLFTWYKHGLAVGVFWKKTKHSKHRLIPHNSWQQHGVVTVFWLNFNNYSKYLKVVIIHGRDNIINCLCIVCTKKFEILTIYSMYRFCSDDCYENYRKLPTDKQRELSS